MRKSRLIARQLAPFVAVLGLCALSLNSPPTATFAAVFLAAAFAIVLSLRIDAAELIVLTMPLTFYVAVGAGRVNISLSDLFLLLLLATVVISPSMREVGRQFRGLTAAIWVCSAFLLASVSLGVFLADAGPMTVDWSGFVLDLMKLVIVLLYFSVSFIAFALKYSQGNYRFMGIWTYTAVVVAALGAVGVMFFQRGVNLGLTMSFRAQGTFEDPNAYAAYLLASVGVAMAWSYLRGGRIVPWQVVPIVVGMYVAYSRAALVTCAIVLLIGFVASVGVKVLRPLRWVVYIGAVVGVLAVLVGEVELFISPEREFSFEGDIRFALWTAALQVWAENPLFGVGLGQFRAATSALVQSPTALLAHNTYLSFLAEGGILGAILFLAIPASVAYGLLREGGVVSRLLLLSVASLLAMAATLNLQNFRPMWVLLGMASAWIVTRNSRSTLPGSYVVQQRGTESL